VRCQDCDAGVNVVKRDRLDRVVTLLAISVLPGGTEGVVFGIVQLQGRTGNNVADARQVKDEEVAMVLRIRTPVVADDGVRVDCAGDSTSLR
jgi:hypothetical protein